MHIPTRTCTLCLVFFTLVSFAADAATPSVLETDASITLSIDDRSILTYHKADVPPPESADPIFTRSGFIHPVHSPSGTVVTGIHPDDHYHHLGLWHAWVECEIEGENVDFWNLKEETGRVRYAKTLSLSWGSDSAGFTVVQEHVAFPGNQEKERVILREVFTVVARFIDGAYEIDYETVQTNVSSSSLKLPAYRYGGPIAYRAPHHWDRSNSDYLSSEGKNRNDGHTTRSKWIAMWGEKKTGPGADTLTILCHRENHDFPQRMRVWPETSNNGAIFFNYVPIQEFAWEISPGQVSTMRYRLVVQNGEPNSYDLNKRWNRFVR